MPATPGRGRKVPRRADPAEATPTWFSRLKERGAHGSGGDPFSCLGRGVSRGAGGAMNTGMFYGGAGLAVVVAFVVGWFAERGWDRSPLRTSLAMSAGCLVLYACGVAQLAAFVGRQAALTSGFYPFVAGDLLKIAVAAGLLPALWKLLERARLVPRP